VKTHTLQLTAVLAASIVFLAAAGSACGGDDEPTIEEFITQAHQLDQNHEQAANPIREKLEASIANIGPADPLPSSVKDDLLALFAEEDRFADDIEEMEAPEAGKQIQADAIVALRAEAAFGRTFAESITPQTTFAEVNAALFESDEATQLMARRSNACSSMQKLANDHRVDVDMTC
jgi:hypothetical protein